MAAGPITERAQRLFAGLGGDYDRWSAWLSFGQDPRWRRCMVSHVTVRPQDHVLDVACGTGLVIRELHRRYGCRITALDQSPGMLAGARERTTEISSDVTFVEGRAEELPFADASFDAVVSNSTLDHFRTRDDIRTALAGLNRVLRSGGRLVLTMDNLRHPGVALRNAIPVGWLKRSGLVPYPIGATLGPRGLARMVRAAGFDIVEMDALLHCPRALAVRRARTHERFGNGSAQRRFLERLGRWERLARFPLRFVTGHYVGILAQKP